MHRFFVSEIPDGGTIALSAPDQLHHLRNVLRLKIGDEVVVFDALGAEYECRINVLEAEEALLFVKTRHAPQAKRVSLTIACAIPKKNKMDDIVDKVTQLGADRIIPLQTSRGIVRLDESGANARLVRWQRLALAAARQSGRSVVPEIAPVAGMNELVALSAGHDLKLVLTLSGERMNLLESLAAGKADSIIVLVGPEGDFTPDEVELTRQAGFIPVSLGRNVLRVETAAIAIASYICLASGL